MITVPVDSLTPKPDYSYQHYVTTYNGGYVAGHWSVFHAQNAGFARTRVKFEAL